MIENIPIGLYESRFTTGSSVICNPPVLNTDIDVMFYTKDMASFSCYLIDNNWKSSFEDYKLEADGIFKAYRKENYNVLLTQDIDYYDRFEEATILATKLNLLEKHQRIALFEYVVNGELK